MTTVTSGAPAPVRITVHGPGGGFDAGLSSSTTPQELLDDRRARHHLGLREGKHAVLVTRLGDAVDPGLPVLAQGVDEGDVLSVLVPAESGSPVPRSGRVRRSAPTPTQGIRPVGPLIAALALLITAALVAMPVGGVVRGGTVGALLAAALLGTVTSPAGEWGDRCRLLAPLAAATGVGTALASPGPGGAHLALTAAAVTATVTAATERARVVGRSSSSGVRQPSPPVADVLLVVLLVSAAVASVLGVGLLVATSLRASGVVVAVAAVLATRLLPSVVVDAPDEALLDLDRLAVTAWSAHEHGPQRGRWRLRSHDVADLVARARRYFGAAAVLASSLAVVGTAGALTSGTTGLEAHGALALAASGGLTLALSARTVRHRIGRTSMMVAAAAIALTLAAVGTTGAGSGWRMLAFASAVLVAGCIVPAAVALGRGWRSVRWARTGDLVEGLAAALVVPAGFVAAGGFDWVRQLVS